MSNSESNSDTLDSTIRAATIRLPDNYTIELDIEYGAVTILLRKPCGFVEFPTRTKPIAEQIHDLIEYAITEATQSMVAKQRSKTK
jgi:hypothetical protein